MSGQPKTSKVRPNAVLYGAAIRACSGAGKWRMGLDLLEVRNGLFIIGIGLFIIGLDLLEVRNGLFIIGIGTLIVGIGLFVI